MGEAKTTKPGLLFDNPKIYPSADKLGERFILRVEARTDNIPGMWHSPQDLMLFIATHPYVKSVKLLEVGPEQKNVRRKQTLPTRQKK